MDRQLEPQDGLSQEELDRQEAAELPNREAMSVVNPNPGMPADDGTVHILPYPYEPEPTEPAPDDGMARIQPYPYEPGPTEPAPDDGMARIQPYPYESEPVAPSPEPDEYTLPYERPV